MNPADHDRFWSLYDARARPAIERACRAASRRLTGNSLPAEDLIAWVEDRLLALIRRDAWPVFHDDPSPEQAAQRAADAATLLARWAYLALARRHWRRLAAEHDALSRAQALAATRRDATFEASEQLNADLELIRRAIDEKTRARLAAAWHDPAQARRVALALGATSDQADQLLQRAASGSIKRNTLDQMRSRSRAAIRQILGPRIVISLACTLALALAAPARATGGEQTGGGRGGAPTLAPDTGGEQTGGGRGG